MNSNIFSLEIFIDRIRLLEGEKCYFPSTVLKLLNYEPTLISTVDHDIQSKLRDYLDAAEHSGDIGKVSQISELKDIDGNYVVRKGKSILFEANTLALIAQFNALPLYILVCDDYFRPSHLVGVVSMRLSEAMANLARKISPVSHTVSEDVLGKFPIVNLMGDAVGVTTMKLRLIFVGANLAPHLPREQEIEIRPRPTLADVIDKSVGETYIGKYIDKIAVRNVGCQVDKKRNVRIQIGPEVAEITQKPHNIAKIGLSIDPNDPILNELPPMVYNSQYGNWSSDSDSDRQTPPKPAKLPQKPQKIAKFPEKPQKTAKLSEKPQENPGKPSLAANLPILEALLHELATWKSQDNLSGRPQSTTRPPWVYSQHVTTKPNIIRSKSADIRPQSRYDNNNREEFLRRLSRPKIRPISPPGIVPRHKGWIRTEPEYYGPARSALTYKLTKTLTKRIEMHNNNRRETNSDLLHQQSMEYSDYTSPTHTPIPRRKRNPLVPPLFTASTSISASSVSPKSHHKRPPLSPGKETRQNNNNNNTNNNSNKNNSRSIFSYDTNETANEADHYLNLNPVQSNRSPHMSVRSHIVPVGGGTDRSNDEFDDERVHSENNEYDSEYRSESNDDRPAAGNRAYEYSEEFNQSYSSDMVMAKSQSRKNSNGSLVSQTSEWRTDYSFGSSTSQRNQPKVESPTQSPDLRTHRSPPRSPMKPRRSLLSSGVMPGGRFLDGTTSGSFRTFDSYKPSVNGSLDISNLDSTSGPRGDHDNSSSRQSLNGPASLLLRPGSAGADVTSFTKVTKYERSVVPGGGQWTGNYGTGSGGGTGVGGTPFVTSTVGSLQTDDSQILTSESYY